MSRLHDVYHWYDQPFVYMSAGMIHFYLYLYLYFFLMKYDFTGFKNVIVYIGGNDAS